MCERLEKAGLLDEKAAESVRLVAGLEDGAKEYADAIAGATDPGLYLYI